MERVDSRNRRRPSQMKSSLSIQGARCDTRCGGGGSRQQRGGAGWEEEARQVTVPRESKRANSGGSPKHSRVLMFRVAAVQDGLKTSSVSSLCPPLRLHGVKPDLSNLTACASSSSRGVLRASNTSLTHQAHSPTDQETLQASTPRAFQQPARGCKGREVAAKGLWLTASNARTGLKPNSCDFFLMILQRTGLCHAEFGSLWSPATLHSLGDLTCLVFLTQAGQALLRLNLEPALFWRTLNASIKTLDVQYAAA